MPFIYIRIEVWLDDASLATWWETSEQTERAAECRRQWDGRYTR